MKRHVLKTDKEAFQNVWNTTHKVQIRFNDRDYKRGHHLCLVETVHTGDEMAAGAPLEYTGRYATATISHISTDHIGLKPGWCLLSIHHVTREEADPKGDEFVQGVLDMVE